MPGTAQQGRTAIMRLADEGADSIRVVDAALSTWRQLAAELEPVIGRRGVAALLARSVQLARMRYPWLGPAASGGLGALRAAMAPRSSREAAAANDLLLQSFADLLQHLLGTALLHRLLGSLLDRPHDGRRRDNFI